MILFIGNNVKLAIYNVSTQPAQVVQTEASPMAKLKKAKKLLAMGIITQEEFDKIKTKCLADL